jgi:hypothetical protein
MASSTTKTGHHDIAEILLKVALKRQKSNLLPEYMEKTTEIYMIGLYELLGNSGKR